MADPRAVAALAGVTVLVALVSEVFVESVQEAAAAFGMSPRSSASSSCALVGGAAEMTSAFSGARKDRLDLSVSIALGSACQVALFVAPVLVLAQLRHRARAARPAVLAGRRADGADATFATSFVTGIGRSAWYVGVQLLMVYAVLAMTLYLLPPAP